MHWSTLDQIRCQMHQYKCNANRWWKNCIRTWSSGIRGMVINMVLDVRNRSKMTVVTHPCFEWRMRHWISLSAAWAWMCHGSAAEMWQHFPSQSRDHGDQWCQRSIKAMRRSVFCPCVCQRRSDVCWRCSVGCMGLKRWSRTSWLSQQLVWDATTVSNCHTFSYELWRALSSFEQWFGSYKL